MPGTGIAVELVLLARLGERLVQFRDLVRARVLVVLAKQPQQRAGQLRCQVPDRPDLEREALGRGADDERAVTVDGGVQRKAAGSQERLAPAGAIADDTHLAAGGRHRPQESRRPADVPDQPLVRDTAERADRRGRVIGARARRFPAVQVRADGQVAVHGKGPGYLLGRRVEPGHVVDHHHAAAGAGPERAGQVRLDLVAAMPGDADGLRHHRVIHRDPSCSCGRRLDSTCP